MKNIIFLLFISFTTIACNTSNTESSSTFKDTTDFAYYESVKYDEYSESEIRYVINVAQGLNYDSLKQIAQDVSMLLHWPLDSLDRYFNINRRKIIVPENSEDEVWAGEYIFRRYGDDFVSVEMMNAYIDTETEKNAKAKDLFYNDSLQMFVCAGIFEDINAAKSVLSKVQSLFPKAQLIKTEMYMGCMH